MLTDHIYSLLYQSFGDKTHAALIKEIYWIVSLLKLKQLKCVDVDLAVFT